MEVNSSFPLAEIAIELAAPYLIKELAKTIAPPLTSFFEHINHYASNHTITKTSYQNPFVGFNADDIKDLRQYSVIDAFRFFLNVFFSPGEEKLDVNWIINKLTNQTGVVKLSEYQEPLNYTLPIQISTDTNFAEINISIMDLSVSGLNSFHDFDFLNAVNGYLFDSSFGLSNLSIDLKFGLQLNIHENSHIHTKKAVLLIEDDFSLSINQNLFDLQLQLVSPKESGTNYTDAQCLNVKCIEAMFSPEDTKFTNIYFNTSIDQFNIVPTEYDPRNQLEYQLYVSIQNVLFFFERKFPKAFPLYLNSLVYYYLFPNLNTGIKSMLTNAKCNNIETKSTSAFNLKVSMIGLGVGLGVVLIIYLINCFAVPYRNHYKYMKLASLVTTGELNMASISGDDLNNFDKTSGFLANFFRNDDQGSLMMNKKLNIFIRLLMPLLIFINAAVFISANSGMGLQIVVGVYPTSERLLKMPSLFDFMIVDSIQKIWNGNAKFLAVLITIFSIIWPYVKLILMLIVWMMPVIYIGKVHRERILKLLDALGKWSFFDTFVMAITIVSFGLILEFPIQDPKCPEPLRVRLMTTPDYAFYALSIGTVFSLAISHVMLGFIRYVDDSLDDTTDKSRNFLFTSCKNVIFRHIITFLIVATLVLYIVGIIFDAFSLHFVGLTGYVMELLNIAPTISYSALNIASKFTSTSSDPNSFGIRFVQVLYCIIVLVIPFLHIIATFILWVIPLSKKLQIFLFKTCEVLYSWASMDVYAISMAGALAEVASFSRTLIPCGNLNNLISEYFYDVPYVPGHQTCFDAYTTFTKGAYILFAGAFTQNFITIAVNIYAKKFLYKQGNDVNAMVDDEPLKPDDEQRYD